MCAAVERELPTGPDGRYDPFAPDSTIYVCSPFPGRHGGGCGHRWDEVVRSIEDAESAIRRIPVTDATATRRANALAHIEGLGEELTHRRSA